MDKPSPQKWDQSAKAWFDEPDALQRIEAMDISDTDRQLLLKFVADGYFIVDGIVPLSDIDAILDDVADIWDAEQPREMTINRLQIKGEFRPSVPHVEILALPKEERDQIRRDSRYTFGDIHPASPPIMAVFRSPELLRIASILFQGPAEPRNSLYFEKGSQQNIHQDSAVFHVHPPHYFVGFWLALEDIGDSCGPLEYYPGTHVLPIWEEFKNYPQDNLRTVSDNEAFRRYDSYLVEATKGKDRKLALLKKGQALFWHGHLIHGGSPVESLQDTRKSLVIHVMKQGTDKQPEILGPFNW